MAKLQPDKFSVCVTRGTRIHGFQQSFSVGDRVEVNADTLRDILHWKCGEIWDDSKHKNKRAEAQQKGQ